MILISHPIFLKHDMPGHPENSERIKKALKLFTYEKAKDGESYLRKVHTQRYIDKVKALSKEAISSFKSLDAGETYVCKDTYEAACYAVGAAVQAAEYAIHKKPAFAMVRPPGHHAHPDWTNGFCVFNSMAIAAAHLAEKKETVLIIDIDMHRGDGTSDCVTQLNKLLDNRLYYFSINQKGVFPGASIDEGNVKNIYIDKETSEEDYIEILKKEAGSLINSFKPTVIAVSAGFDSFAKDKETHNTRLGCGLNLTRKTVIELKKLIGTIPSFAVLEGGYNPESVVEGVGAFIGAKLPEEKKAKKKEEGKKEPKKTLTKPKKSKPAKKKAAKKTKAAKKPKPKKTKKKK